MPARGVDDGQVLREGNYGLGRLSNVAGPLIIAALCNGSGYQSVFFFIAGTWLFGALVLAFFGPKTRQASLAQTTKLGDLTPSPSRNKA